MGGDVLEPESGLADLFSEDVEDEDVEDDLDEEAPEADGDADLGDLEVERIVAEESRRRPQPAVGSIQRRLEQMPQLSDDVQAELVLAVHRGRDARQRLAALPPGSKQPRELVAQVQQADVAAERLVGSMYRLVLRMVREQAERRYGRERASEMLGDLLQEGCAAVVEAAGKFEPYKSPSFAVYAARVVRDRVRLVLTREQSAQAMKLPAAWTRVRRLYAVWHPKLTEELGRPPRHEEMQMQLLELALEWAEGKLTPEQQALSPAEQHAAKMTRLRKQGMLGAIEKLDEVLRSTQQVASIDAPTGEDGESTLGDFLTAEDSEDAILEDVARQQMRKDVLAALQDLTDRERTIVLHRYGFVDGESWTYPKISEMFGVSAERIRQIEKVALSKLGATGGAFGGLQRHLPSHYDA